MFSEPFDSDPDLKVREWFKENVRRRSNEEEAEQRLKQIDRLIPHGILESPATNLNCQNLSYILSALKENAGGNRGAKEPEEIDMSAYEGAETVGELVRQYLSQRALEEIPEEDTAKLLEAFEEMLSETWDERPPEAERRRWVATMRLTWPPRLFCEQEEVARLSENLPGGTDDLSMS